LIGTGDWIRSESSSAPGSSPTGHAEPARGLQELKIKQYHKLGKAIRTETTINDARDFGIGKRLTNLPALRQVGFTANRPKQ